MKLSTLYPYLLNCFLLILPVLFWDLFLTDKLPAAFQPEMFWNNIPPILSYGENISRTCIFILTACMPLQIGTRKQKSGLFIYGAGIVLYFSSWLILIFSPDSAWSKSLPGFMAPAYTPFFWLLGIGLAGKSFYFRLPYRLWFFMLVALAFLVFHNLHAYTVYNRLADGIIN